MCVQRTLTNHYTDICDDDKQLLYTKCTYVYPSDIQCTNPVPKYLEPLLCGGHCDNIKPPHSCSETLMEGTGFSRIEGSVCLETSTGEPAPQGDREPRTVDVDVGVK